MSRARAEQWIERAAGPAGWGYLAGGTPRLEPTLWALAAAPTAAAVPGALDWLASQPLSWEWTLLPCLLAELDGAHALREQALAHLLEAHGVTPAGVSHLDGTLVGWTWYPGASTWLEPTAFAMCALRRSGQPEHPRVVEGRRVIADRVCVDGGWNYGNGEVLDTNLLSYIHSTAWALMALAPGDPLVAPALGVLERAFERPSTRALATSSLALMAHGQDPARWIDLLRARQAEDGSFGDGRVDRTALAIVALRAAEEGHSAITGDTVFRPPVVPEPAAPPATPSEGLPDE